MDILHGLAIWFGLNDGAGHSYLFWSGVGADITELAIVGGLIHMARSANCHVHGCWRIGGHPVEGTPYKVCRKHHPDIADHVTLEHVQHAHAAHVRQSAGATPAPRPRKKKDEDAHATA